MLPKEPRVSHLREWAGTWSPVPVRSVLEADPLPERKRGQLPEGFWEEVLKRRAAFKK